MNNERYKEVDMNGGTLTKEELAEGWHFCPEWDYMLTNMNDTQGETCSCKKAKQHD